MTKITVIGGSNRSEAQSHRIAEIATAKLNGILGDAGSAELLSLRDVAIPIWDESKWSADKPADSFWASEWPKISEGLKSSDGFVIVTPEWHGMASPMVKNLLCCCDGRELAFKPGYLISVSGSIGGAYPVAELRMSGYKNTFLHWLPEHLIIRNVAGFLPGSPENTAPEWLEKRMDHGLEVLIETAKALKPVRENVIDHELLKLGM